MEKLFYKDFETGVRRWTNGEPVRAVQGGPLNTWYLVIRRRASDLLIPEYCLEGAGKAWLNEHYPRHDCGERLYHPKDDPKEWQCSKCAMVRPTERRA